MSSMSSDTTITTSLSSSDNIFSLNNDQNSNSDSSSEINVQHPLFHMAIVSRIQKIPFLSRTILLVSESYSKLKSGSDLIGIMAKQIENRIRSIAFNIVHYVPKQPIEIMDQIACQGLEILETNLCKCAQFSKKIRDQTIQIPQTFWRKMSEFGIFEGIYDLFYWIFNMMESSLEYFLPIVHPPRPEATPVVQINKGIRRFIEHFLLHLVEYTKARLWIVQLMTLLNPIAVDSAPSLTSSASEDTTNVINKDATNVSKTKTTITETTTEITKPIVEVLDKLDQSEVKLEGAIQTSNSNLSVGDLLNMDQKHSPSSTTSNKITLSTIPESVPIPNEQVEDKIQNCKDQVTDDSNIPTNHINYQLDKNDSDEKQTLNDESTGLQDFENNKNQQPNKSIIEPKEQSENAHGF